MDLAAFTSNIYLVLDVIACIPALILGLVLISIALLPVVLPAYVTVKVVRKLTK